MWGFGFVVIGLLSRRRWGAGLGISMPIPSAHPQGWTEGEERLEKGAVVKWRGEVLSMEANWTGLPSASVGLTDLFMICPLGRGGGNGWRLVMTGVGRRGQRKVDAAGRGWVLGVLLWCGESDACNRFFASFFHRWMGRDPRR